MEISEKSVYFGALKAGETLTKDVKLSTPYGESLTFLSVDNSKQEVFATQVAAPTQGDTLPVTITTTGIIPAGTPAGVVKGHAVVSYPRGRVGRNRPSRSLRIDRIVRSLEERGRPARDWA